MLSRVANTLYWMQRYRERAENLSRLVEVNLNLSIDLPESDMQWRPLLRSTGVEEHFEKKGGGAFDEKKILHFLTFDLENPNSILSCLVRARENARSVRDIITSEMWQELNTTYLFVQKMAHQVQPFESPYSIYNRIKRQCQLFTGIADTTMSKNEAWHFGRLGALIERADMTSRFLDVKYYILLPSPEYVGTALDNIQWSALLKSASAYEMYRKKWRQISHAHVVEFLVLDHEFPRAIYSCLEKAEDSLTEIGSPLVKKHPRSPVELLQKIRSGLDEITVEKIISSGLHEFLDHIQEELIELDQRIHDVFFALSPREEK